MKVFITGGTGTLGKEIIKRFHNKWKITSYSRDELKLSQIERQYPDVNFIIGDIGDYDALQMAMRGSDAVIHAAAMKRIEVCEANPMEAVKTNIIGTQNVIYALIRNGIKKAVVTGSDKSVEPINVYGMTKGIQEKLFSSHNFNSVRYGNVFGSRGSVAPLFADQASRGLPLTVTDPEMTRFLLTIDDAIQLILFALESPMDGSIFVKKLSAAKLIDIAHAFSNNVKIIGKWPGEKKNEALINAEEFTRLRKIKSDFVAIGKKQTNSQFGESFTSDIAKRLSVKEIKKLIKTCELF
jgi:UDP-glucose 4-epimerase